MSESAVATEIEGFTIASGPPAPEGSESQYPPATRLVIAALLNCTFSNLKVFCEKREIPTEGLAMDFGGEYEEGIYRDMTFTVHLPQAFPDKYRASLDKIFSACSVKKIMQNLPEIQIEIQ